MNEQQPPQRHPEDSGSERPRDEHERVGDMYEGEFTEKRRIESAERLTQPLIWVGSLVDYNNGELFGDWIQADQDAEAIQQAVHELLARSPWTARTGEPAEEWGIFDHDGFGSLRIDEHEGFSWISAVAKGITEHGLAFAAWAQVVEEADALDGFEDAYLGHYESVEGYAAQLVDDLGYDRLLDQDLPGSMRAYVRVDTDALARDLVLSGDVHVLPAEDGGVWLFDAR